MYMCVFGCVVIYYAFVNNTYIHAKYQVFFPDLFVLLSSEQNREEHEYSEIKLFDNYLVILAIIKNNFR